MSKYVYFAIEPTHGNIRTIDEISRKLAALDRSPPGDGAEPVSSYVYIGIEPTQRNLEAIGELSRQLLPPELVGQGAAEPEPGPEPEPEPEPPSLASFASRTRAKLRDYAKMTSVGQAKDILERQGLATLADLDNCESTVLCAVMAEASSRINEVLQPVAPPPRGTD